MNQFLVYSLTFTGAVLFLTFIFFLVKNAAEGEVPESWEPVKGKINRIGNETRRESIVNYLFLDVEQENDFFYYLECNKVSENAPDETILYMHDKWLLQSRHLGY